jgi:predicted RNA binding protein YcfA (HicA-like mRNA interferase family)
LLALLLSLLSIESTTEFIGDVQMFTNSCEIKRRLECEGWTLVRVKGSHHIFRNPKTGMIISLPHPKKDLGQGLVSKICRDANWPKD